MAKHVDLASPAQLKKLPVRNTPHYMRLDVGQALGYRKTGPSTGFWFARLSHNYAQRVCALGAHTPDFGFTQAKAKAEVWFAAPDAAQAPTAPRARERDALTVWQGCERYIESLIAQGRQDAARDASVKLTAKVKEDALGALALSAVEIADFDDWRARIKLKPATYNRVLRSLRAALNYCARKGYCARERRLIWEEIEGMPLPKNQSSRREVTLDRAERARLLAQCGTGAFRNFILGAMHTGARGGELASARVKHLDVKRGSITLCGKVGQRTVPLSDEALRIFGDLAADRDGEEYLFECTELWDNRHRRNCRVECSPFVEHLAKDRDEDEPRVIPRIWQSQQWCKMFRAAAAAAKLPQGTVLYSLRHSWITEQLQITKLTLAEVARLAGTSIQMIDKHYHHLQQDEVRAKMNRIKMV